jgi:hypothetical protein
VSYTHDSYVSNVLSDEQTESFRQALDAISVQQRALGFRFPAGKRFQTIGQLRESLTQAGVSTYLTVSLSTRYRRTAQGLEYRFLEGWTVASGGDAEAFFRRTNLAMFGAKVSARPAGEFWYAMVSGHFPDRLIGPLTRYRDLFQAVKVGSSRPIALSDERYEPLWRWCAAEELPVLLHCSGENESDFFDGLEICRRHPSLLVTLSHLGGMKQSGEDPDEGNRRQLLRRARVLNSGLPDNLMLNNAVYNLKLCDYLCDAAPCLESRILSALDLPFFGSIEEVVGSLASLRTWEAIKENTVRYLDRQFAAATREQAKTPTPHQSM